MHISEFIRDQIIKVANDEGVNNRNIQCVEGVKIELLEIIDISNDTFLCQVILDERERDDEIVRVADSEFQGMLREHFRGIRDYGIFICDDEPE